MNTFQNYTASNLILSQSSTKFLDEFFRIRQELSYMDNLLKPLYDYIQTPQKTKFPVHEKFDLGIQDGYDFRFLLQVVIPTREKMKEILKRLLSNPQCCDLSDIHIVTGVTLIPGENLCTFHLYNNGYGWNNVEIFSAHFMEQYSQRTGRDELDRQLKLKKRWHHSPTDANNPQYKEKEYVTLLDFTERFFRYNKSFLLSEKKDILSKEEKINYDILGMRACLWAEGVSFAIPINNANTVLHKSYVPYISSFDAYRKDQLFPDQIKACWNDFLELEETVKNTLPEYHRTFQSTKKALLEKMNK